MSFRGLAGVLWLLVGCGGVATYPAPATPDVLVGDDRDEFLWYCDRNGPDQDGVWQVQGDAPDCEKPFLPTWESLPLQVYAEEQFAEETLRAVEAWNAWMGVEVFRVTSDWQAANVVVGEQKHLHPAVVAWVYHGTYLGEHVAQVNVSRTDLFDAETAAHELGHVMGLSHDFGPGDQFSVMSYGSGLLQLEPRDRSALLRLYGRLL